MLCVHEVQVICLFSKFEEALEAISANNNSRFTIEIIGIAYLDNLLNRGLYDKAGSLCLKIFGSKKRLWEDQVYKFADRNCLRSISPYIPKSLENKLDPQIYEIILYEYLKMDSQVFYDDTRTN